MSDSEKIVDQPVKEEVSAPVDVKVRLFGLPVTASDAVASHRVFMGSVREFLDGLKSAE